MIVIAILLFFILFVRVRSYKECMGGGTTSGGASNSSSGGGYAGRDYGLEAFLPSVYDDLNPVRRPSGVFSRCSPESHPYGCGSKAAALNVAGVQKIWGIPHVPRYN